MEMTIFFSWQSDIKNEINQSFIQDALESVTSHIRDDDSISIDPVIDRDTKNIPGTPDINLTIFEKIDNCKIFIADVTIINSKHKGRKTPNPNVLIELGYALKALDSKNILLVLNTAYGKPEELPFDLRPKRVVDYYYDGDKALYTNSFNDLKNKFINAISLIVGDPFFSPQVDQNYDLKLVYKEKNIESNHHDYQLSVELLNHTNNSIKEWHVDVNFPTLLLQANVSHFLKVENRSDNEYTLFRSSNNTHKGIIYPGDKKVAMIIDYYIDDTIYHREQTVLDNKVVASLFINNEYVKTEEIPVKNIQRF